MKGDQPDEPKAEPVSISMMNEDPAHLAGRLEEYATLSEHRPPNLGMFHEWELKEKFEALVKAMRSRPRLLQWGFNHLATVINPRWLEASYEARFERMFQDEPDVTPSEAAMRVLGTLRMPLRMKPFILVKAQRVKRRMEQRRRDQEKRDMRQGGV
jgi:hypothetical protein